MDFLIGLIYLKLDYPVEISNGLIEHVQNSDVLIA